MEKKCVNPCQYYLLQHSSPTATENGKIWDASTYICCVGLPLMIPVYSLSCIRCAIPLERDNAATEKQLATSASILSSDEPICWWKCMWAILTTCAASRKPLYIEGSMKVTMGYKRMYFIKKKTLSNCRTKSQRFRLTTFRPSNLTYEVSSSEMERALWSW